MFVSYEERVAKARTLWMSLIDNSIRLKRMEESFRTPDDLPGLLPDMSQCRNLLADVSVIVPEIVGPILEVIQFSDMVSIWWNVRVPTLVRVSRMEDFTTGLKQRIQPTQRAVDGALTILVERFGFQLA